MSKQIANTILSQIDAMADGGSFVNLISNRDYTVINESNANQGGVSFTLKANPLVKVVVTLSYADDYTVTAYLGTGQVSRVDGIYCDMLADSIFTIWEQGKAVKTFGVWGLGIEA